MKILTIISVIIIFILIVSVPSFAKCRECGRWIWAEIITGTDETHTGNGGDPTICYAEGLVKKDGTIDMIEACQTSKEANTFSPIVNTRDIDYYLTWEKGGGQFYNLYAHSIVTDDIVAKYVVLMNPGRTSFVGSRISSYRKNLLVGFKSKQGIVDLLPIQP